MNREICLKLLDLSCQSHQLIIFLFERGGKITDILQIAFLAFTFHFRKFVFTFLLFHFKAQDLTENIIDRGRRQIDPVAALKAVFSDQAVINGVADREPQQDFIDLKEMFVA